MDSIFYFYMLNASNYIFTKKKKIKLEKFSSLFFSKFIFLTSLVTCSRKMRKRYTLREVCMYVHGAGKRNGKGPSVKVNIFQSDTGKQINLK